MLAEIIVIKLNLDVLVNNHEFCRIWHFYGVILSNFISWSESDFNYVNIDVGLLGCCTI
jgi:hypothetical protein